MTSARHSIFQTSLMSALLDGVYDGEMTLGELLGHGGFGIGTFNGLDGEMVLLGGQAWQLRGDGSVSVPSLDQRTPYAVVTNFVPTIAAPLPQHATRAEVATAIDELLGSENYMYALRITGTFREVVTRTVTKQDKPYRPMVDATDDDAILRVHDLPGTVVAFRTPLYEQGIGVPGCHAHFIDDARTRGGHVLDFTLVEGAVEICMCTDLHLQLPLTREFRSANLAPADIEAQLHKTENKSAPGA